MSISNGYTTLAELKSWIGGIGDTNDDGDLERAVEAASRAIDEYCGRVFYDAGSASARTYVADDSEELDVHDFSTTAGLVVKTDDNSDGTFETSWDATGSPADYQPEPLVRVNGYPYTRIVAIDDKAFPVSRRRALVQVTAQWGWAAVPTDVKQACLILAARLFKRKETSTGVIGFDGMGTTVRITAQDVDVRALLDPLRRLGVRGV